MRIFSSIGMVAATMIVALITAGSLALDAFDIVVQTGNFTFNWKWFAFVAFIIFAILIFIQLFAYRRKYISRGIADKLGEFARELQTLRDRQAANQTDLEAYTSVVVPHEQSIENYLKKKCGSRYAFLYSHVQNRNYGEFDVLPQLDARLSNLRKIIEEYDQKSK